VLFVADPATAPPRDGFVYARPDDLSDSGESWREVLVRYNEYQGNNPLGLCRAAELYVHPIYARMVSSVGIENIYILSAGWGLINASFLTPNYDITFSVLKQPDRYKRRRSGDIYGDFAMLPRAYDEPIFFFGGKYYVPLFCKLTDGAVGKRTVFFNSQDAPEAQGCAIERFVTTTRTNWHYECASAFLTSRFGRIGSAARR
jgi:hypothetical protein